MPEMPPARDVVFYDGGCGLCRGLVRFAAARDARGALLFAPLGGETFRAALAPEARARLPDSLVVLRGDGRVLEKAAAVSHVLARLGGAWSLLGALLRHTPRRLANRGYDTVARARRRRTTTLENACPFPRARGRFLP